MKKEFLLVTAVSEMGGGGEWREKSTQIDLAWAMCSVASSYFMGQVV